jgi:hypothetical protein
MGWPKRGELMGFLILSGRIVGSLLGIEAGGRARGTD